MTTEEALRAVVDAIPDKYKSVLTEMLARALEEARSRDEAIDTREGSVIYSALAPAAFEIAQLHARIDAAMNEAFADTASRHFLVRRAAEIGLEPYSATHAVLVAEFNIAIDIGTRFSFRRLTYEVIESLGAYYYAIRCEQPGAVGNVQAGAELVPIPFIDGLNQAEVRTYEHILVAGKDEEGTEAFRARYLATLSGNAFGGNIQSYKNLIMGMDGVGAVKVFPADPAGGHVLLMILNTDFAPPSLYLIEQVWKDTDPETFEGVNGPTAGLGLGKAPIGHKVTVSAPQLRIVDVSVQLAPGVSITTSQLTQGIEDYFRTAIETEWGRVENVNDFNTALRLRMTGLNPVINNVANSITFNGETDITLQPKEIPVLGHVEVT